LLRNREMVELYQSTRSESVKRGLVMRREKDCHYIIDLFNTDSSYLIYIILTNIYILLSLQHLESYFVRVQKSFISSYLFMVT